jgi:hypothetical protein
MKASLALGALLGSALLAASASAANSAASSFQLTAVQTSFVTAPAISKSSPPQIGGRMIFENVLYNRGPQFGRPAGARVGTADIVCTLVSKAYLDCTIDARLPGGQLVLSGSVPNNSSTNDYAITGGAGAYANATGSSTGRQINETKTLVTVNLGG